MRILSATHKDLAGEVAAGRFRQDLYYRLNVIELPIPSLRERPSDIGLLADQILTRLAADYASDKPELSDEALTALEAYPFPGNVRELENVLERAFTLCEANRIETEDLQLAPAAVNLEKTPESAPAVETPPAAAAKEDNLDGLELAPGESLEDFLESIEKKLIVEALESTRWNKTAAAKKLGITFRALRYRLQKLELE